MSAVLLLGHTLLKNVFQIVFPKSLFKFRFSCRVNPLPDNYRIFSDFYCLGKGGYYRSPFPDNRNWCFRSAALIHLSNMLWRRAAAAACNPRPHIHNFFHDSRKFFCVNIIHRFPVFTAGKACVGIDHNGNRGNLQKLLQNLPHLCRSQTAVHSQNINAKTFQHGCHRSRTSSGEQFSSLIKGYCHKYRKTAGLLCRQHCCLCLISITHGFDQNQIRACLHPCFYHLPVQADRILKLQIPQRLQQLSCRPHIQSHICLFPRKSNSLSGIFHCSLNHQL